MRAVLMLLSFFLFYTAAGHLGLAEVTTLYFSAPLIVMLLSMLILKDKVGWARWLVLRRRLCRRYHRVYSGELR